MNYKEDAEYRKRLAKGFLKFFFSNALRSHTLRLAVLFAILDKFGIEEHFMTDYGDEATHTDPWSLFSEEDAREALEMAEKCYCLAEEIYRNYLK